MVFLKEKLSAIRTLWHLMKDTGGQMAIFVALIFQILFVFFAMIINIGLTVHDKINLQNSVDLAAYYAASKQAEILNVLAHINYQIRQEYKLLAYRQRVIGTFGNLSHPAHPNNGGPFQDSPMAGDNGALAEQPAICVSHTQWRDYLGGGQNENLCKRTDHKITALPSTPIIAGFNPINITISAMMENLKQGISVSCNQAAVQNWYFTAIINYIYKLDLKRRKEAFLKIARTLSVSEGDFSDLDGRSVLEGVEKTLEKNLTRANRLTLIQKGKGGSGKVLLFNSLGTGQSQAIPLWIADIPIEPVLLYTFHQSLEAGGCENFVRALTDPTRPAGANALDPNNELQAYIGEPQDTHHLYHSSRGFEKNPWYMAYVGVYAETQPRKPFAPFGSPVKLRAVAFAKPFGGRLGPWERTAWPRNSPRSEGGQLVDPLAVPRGGQITGNLAQDKIFIPNYSRYPGDQLGLQSTLGASFGKNFLDILEVSERAAREDYISVIRQLDTDQGDPIAFNPNIRTSALFMAERAAIAPDLFDITYYSIEPQFNKLYVDKPLVKNAGTPRDLGTKETFPGSIENQFVVAQEAKNGGNGSNYFYILSSIDHVLTGWAQEGEGTYLFFPKNFGTCSSHPTTREAPPVSGNCIMGGRTGYSVKLVSRDYLMSENHQLGGQSTEKGSIINKLPNEFINLLN